jgi:hypothetical protein
MAGSLNAQGLANTRGRMRVLEGRAGTFNARMWQTPCGVTQELEVRAEAMADMFNSQEVANMLWAACVLSTFRSPEEQNRSVLIVGAPGVLGQDYVLEYRSVVPALPLLCVVQLGAEAWCGGNQRHAVFESDVSFGVRGHTDNPSAAQQQARRCATWGCR